MTFRALGLWALSGIFSVSNAHAQLSPSTKAPTRVQDKLTDNPVHQAGLTMNQIASCIVITQLPWVFRKTKRQSRLIIRDKIRFSTSADFATWEIHQVMDQNGYISYVFKRPLPGGGFESFVTKENHYNRIVDKGGVKKIVDVRNLTTLVDRPALTFYTEGSGRIVYQPGLSGQAQLFLAYSTGEPPVWLKGSDCRRGCVDGRDPFSTNCADVSFGDDAGLADTPGDAPAAAPGKR